jgi:2-hydroxychromene-2-carboxylate isomerase
MIEYFHQVDDPYSHLLAQMLRPLTRRYGVTVKPWLVPPPDDAAAPERERLIAYARRDAPRASAAYGLSFPQNAGAPEPQAVALAQGILAGSLGAPDFPERAVEVGEALWRGDLEGLRRLSRGSTDAAQALDSGGARRRELGHYLGAMLHHEGQWYWGVDRLNHLEEALTATDTTPDAAPLAPYRAMTLGPKPSGPAPGIEMWFSFRSPYSWIAFPRVRQLARHYGAPLTLRPILPMVMRGLPVPPIKSFYIVRDTKREADRAGLPFGPISDPVGSGAERALAVLHHVAPLGLGESFAESALRAAWAEGVALADDAGLIGAAQRAGVSEAQVAAALADESWRVAAEANRLALFDVGLWGAPTYRIEGGPAHWGQDRLWTLEEDLMRAMTRS